MGTSLCLTVDGFQRLEGVGWGRMEWGVFIGGTVEHLTTGDRGFNSCTGHTFSP